MQSLPYKSTPDGNKDVLQKVSRRNNLVQAKKKTSACEASVGVPMAGKRIKIEDRFWKLVAVKTPDQCWEWLGTKNSNGYGGVIRDRKRQLAHRVSWELHNLMKIEDGMHACHSCDNRWCVNPHHIWIGTRSDNMMDCVSKGRHSKSKMTHCKNGHEFSSDNTRLEGTSRRCITCKRIYDESYRQRKFRAHPRASGP